MSNSTPDTPTNTSDRKHTPGRPPVHWPTQKHVMSEDSRRAAELARAQVHRAQASGAIHKKSEKIIKPSPDASNEPEDQITHETRPSTAERVNSTNEMPTSPGEAFGTEKDVENRAEVQPAASNKPMREEPFDWQAYHRAWQQYYHRYFYQYYAGWRLQQKPYQTAQSENNIAQPEDEEAYKKRVAKEARSRIRTTVRTSAKKVSASHHFKPIIAGLSVGLAFLLISYNQVIIGAAKQYVAPGSVVTTPVIVEPNLTGKVSKAPKIIIPKIGVEAPVVYDEPKVDEVSYQKALERGVVRLGNTANPGTNGNVVIGGHSSNNVFNPGKYKYVFVNLRRLEVGDVFYLNYGGKRYTYKVFVAKKIVPPSDVSSLASTGQPIVTLFTCDPPGTNTNRLIVQARQIDPDPAGATSETTSTTVNSTNPLPSTAPSFWKNLFGL